MANLKRNMIELVTDVKEGEIITKKYLTPPFIPLSVVYEALDLEGELQDRKTSPKETFDKMLDFVATKIYNGQFTKEDLFNGLHAPDAANILREQVLFVAQGRQNEETKKYLAKNG
ncbi:phage tail assembly chaperone G [Heyndrickxia faecalis]|uniref:phage tail assembly chaperone G n=1 Tax=Heyndrickxia faecalis TaxID=2824910 RepID=UPI003D218FBF